MSEKGPEGCKPPFFSINSQGDGLDSGAQCHDVHTGYIHIPNIQPFLQQRKRERPSQTSPAREKQLRLVRLMGCNIPATSAMVLEDLYLEWGKRWPHCIIFFQTNTIYSWNTSLVKCLGFLFNSLEKTLAATQYCNAYMEILMEQLAMRKKCEFFYTK